ncbi:MAG TPA: hypothetical protein VJL87_07380 [Bdellovibrionota bacterium]|nr:hypothetical protein [Bdellovibrionota bacterium]
MRRFVANNLLTTKVLLVGGCYFSMLLGPIAFSLVYTWQAERFREALREELRQEILDEGWLNEVGLELPGPKIFNEVEELNFDEITAKIIQGVKEAELSQSPLKRVTKGAKIWITGNRSIFYPSVGEERPFSDAFIQELTELLRADLPKKVVLDPKDDKETKPKSPRDKQ